MDRRTRRKNMSILPPIHEANGSNDASSKTNCSKQRWMMMLALAACSGATYTKVIGPQHRQLSVLTRPALRNIPKHTLLFDDGTLFAPQGGEPICDYLTLSKRRHTQVKRLHLHLQSCQDYDDNDDDDSSSSLNDYFEALLLANAAQVPFTMTCGSGSGDMIDDSLMSRLVVDHNHIGHVPMDMDGRSWNPADLCRGNDDNNNLFLIKDTIRQTIQDIVPKPTTIHDMVIQFDPSVPIATYTELIVEARFERGSVESIAISTGTNEPHYLLLQHLERTFPEIEIQVSADDDLLHLYSRLVYANIAGICSTPSVCSYAMLSSRGFLNEDGSPPRWVLDAIMTDRESSAVELFKSAAATTTEIQDS